MSDGTRRARPSWDWTSEARARARFLQSGRWCWGPSLRCRPPAAPPVTDRPGRPPPPPLAAPRRKWQPERTAGVGRGGRGETVRSGRRPWGGGPAGGLTCSGEGPPTPARGKSKMAALAETEKDRGGGSGSGPRDARLRLARGRREWGVGRVWQPRASQLQSPACLAHPNILIGGGCWGRAASWRWPCPQRPIVSYLTFCLGPNGGTAWSLVSVYTWLGCCSLMNSSSTRRESQEMLPC